MSKIGNFLEHELLELAGPTLFFFLAFNIIAFTKKLFLEDYHISFSGFFVTASIGALLVGKVVLLADGIPFINRFPQKPLIYNVVWKTAIYSLAALVVQFLEEFLFLIWHHQSLTTASAKIWHGIHWPHFWAVHILLCYFLLIYVSFRELAHTFGEARFFHLFIGLPRTLSSDRLEEKELTAGELPKL